MFKNRFRIKYQLDSSDCGPACLKMIANYYGKRYAIKTLRERSLINKEGVSVMGLCNAAETIGFKTLGVKLCTEQLQSETPLPCIIHWNQNHFMVLYKIKKSKKGYRFFVADPMGAKMVYNRKEFEKGWLSSSNMEKGICLLLEPTPDFFVLEGEKKPIREFRQIISYLKPFKKLFLQLILSLLFASIVQLLLPFFTQSIIDIGIKEVRIDFIYLILIAQFVLMSSKTLVEFIRGWILLHIGSSVNISLISDFLKKLMKLPISFFDSKMIGDIMQRIGDHERIEDFLTSQSLQIVFSLFNLVVFSIVLLFYSIKIFIVFLFGSLLYMLWVSLFMKKRRVLDNKNFSLSSENQSNLLQIIYGMQEIKLNNCERQKRKEWEKIQVKTYNVGMKSLALSQYQQTGGLFINESKNILITFFSAIAVVNGEFTLGAMLAIQYIIGQLNAPLEQLIDFLRTAQDAKISYERLTEVHSIQNEDSEDEVKLVKFLHGKNVFISNLSFSYAGPNPDLILKNINLTIPHGKVTAIVGQSGSGKTTLIKLLLGFYSPQSGIIQIGNKKLNEYSGRFWRQNCGVVMQDGYIFSDSIARNIAISDKRINQEKLLTAVKTANIYDFIISLPLGFNTKVGADGIGLSQGQKQRILIARAVYKDPEYIFFDEATNSLDTTNEKEIMENLQSFFKGRTVIIVAHRLSTVQNADQIVVLANGEVVENDNHKNLVIQRGSYYSLVKNQLELSN